MAEERTKDAVVAGVGGAGEEPCRSSSQVMAWWPRRGPPPSPLDEVVLDRGVATTGALAGDDAPYGWLSGAFRLRRRGLRR